jgi:hypothetical protein
MNPREIRAGNGTHTGRMLGYCPDCGLYHGGAEAAASCNGLTVAVGAGEEAVAWLALKVAIAAEESSNEGA